MFESLEDSSGLLYDSLLSAKAELTDHLAPTSDTLFYMPALDRGTILKTAYQGTFIQDWAIVIFVVIFILMVSVRITNDKYLKQLIQSNFNITVARRLFGERNYTLVQESFRLDLVFIMCMGFLIFHAVHQFNLPHSHNNLVLYLICSGGIFAWLILKLGLYRLTGSIFQTKGETHEYLYYHQTGNRVLGLFLFPMVFVLFFTKGITDNIIMGLCAVMLLFFSLIIIIRGFRIIRKKEFSIYYPFLYLCTLEFAPLIVVGLLLVRLI